MEANLFTRLQATLLALATAALFLLALLNLRQERQFQQPDDGVWWREAPGGWAWKPTKSSPTCLDSRPESKRTTCSPE